MILGALAAGAALSGEWLVFALLAASAAALGAGAVLEPTAAVAIASSIAERPRPIDAPRWNGHSPALARVTHEE